MAADLGPPLATKCANLKNWRCDPGFNDIFCTSSCDAARVSCEKVTLIKALCRCTYNNASIQSYLDVSTLDCSACEMMVGVCGPFFQLP